MVMSSIRLPFSYTTLPRITELMIHIIIAVFMNILILNLEMIILKYLDLLFLFSILVNFCISQNRTVLILIMKKLKTWLIAYLANTISPFRSLRSLIRLYKYEHNRSNPNTTSSRRLVLNIVFLLFLTFSTLLTPIF